MLKAKIVYVGLEWLCKHHEQATDTQMDMFILDLIDSERANPDQDITKLCRESWKWVITA